MLSLGQTMSSIGQVVSEFGRVVSDLELSSPKKFSTGDVPNRTNELYNNLPENLSLPEKWSSPEKLRASRDGGDYPAMVESNPQW
ncbi:uncharacterized protein HKW66_Vig0147230 [Vigna angularis]|uniref:Uncharacterized protein n=1 Tax=Phaseolus angularis TaxID=3914 RepID=A0A8T0JYZ1_PHAAN|nr:uncharacterized protein HKW66_Vig0147230 [Vigna angularis]